ncbi:TPA: nucleotide exchange factor GrpE, partial [Pasteurella multocida]|nr:nucleotide exchange factor GrpE [Pasteurella multocida]
MSNKEQHIEKEEQLQEEKHEEQQKTEETEVEAVNGVDPLEEAILRVQELEAQLTEMVKKEQDFLLRSRAEMDNIRRR